MRQINELFAQMKNFYCKQKQDDQELLEVAGSVLGHKVGLNAAGADHS